MVRNNLTRGVTLILVLLTPGLLILSFPDFGFALLAWIGLTPFFYGLATRPLSLKRCFVYGWLAGALFFYGSSSWITYSVIHYGELPAWLAYSLAIIPAVALGAFWALVAMGIRWAITRVGLIGFLFGPPLWAVSEWARLVCTGMGWNALGYSQAFQPHLIQVAQYTGVYGVSFLLVGVSSLLALGLGYAVTRDAIWLGKPGRIAGALGIGSLLLVVVAGYRTGVETVPTDRHSESEVLRVTGIQPNVPIESALDPSRLARTFDRMVWLTERELASPPVTDLVIWPESPLNLSLHRSPEVVLALKSLARQHAVFLMLNVIGETPPDRWHNSVAVFSPDGEVIGEYHKLRLLPFGEYVPLRGVIPLVDQIPALAGDFSPGETYTLVDIGKAQVGSFICSEAAIPEIARRLTEAGATLLVELTNDSWFGPTPAARQHLAHAVFRAVENQRDLIRVTNSGLSVHITPEGKLIGETSLFQEQTRHWAIHPAPQTSGLTFYTRYGDGFILVCAMVSAMMLGLCLASPK
jgi:apolipoprotein N-acyltransferase